MKRDLFGECYTGEHQQKLKPEEFRKLFCRLCRSERCSLSAVGKSLHALRMENQEDILLINPRFGDPNDPQYAEVRAMQFKDMLREAMALEISSQKGDWEIPTQEDAVQFAQEAAGDVTPQNFQVEEKLPEAVLTVSEDGKTAHLGTKEVVVSKLREDLEEEILWEGDAKGRGKKKYQIRLTQEGEHEPTWSCTCPAFEYKTAAPEGCKHILEARELYEAQVVGPEPAPPPPEEPVAPPPKPNPAVMQQMRDKGVAPRTQNTRFPSDGLMVDGSAPPEETPQEADPWAPPPEKKPKGKVVEVHGKVKMGGGS